MRRHLILLGVLSLPLSGVVSGCYPDADKIRGQQAIADGSVDAQDTLRPPPNDLAASDVPGDSPRASDLSESDANPLDGPDAGGAQPDLASDRPDDQNIVQPSDGSSSDSVIDLGGAGGALGAGGAPGAGGAGSGGSLFDGAVDVNAGGATGSGGAAGAAGSGGATGGAGSPGTGGVGTGGSNGVGGAGTGGTTTAGGAGGAGGATGVTSLISGTGYSCALLNDKTVWCWGDNTYGQLGEASTASFESVPVKLPSYPGAIALGGGLVHTCAVFADGTIKCWGDNAYGELGNGSLTNVGAIAGGWGSTCARLKDGTAACWGNNSSGQLGVVLSSGDRTSIPHAVPNLSSVTALAMGWAHSCALLGDRSVKCWGDGSDGNLGNGQSGTGVSSTSPVQVGSLSSVVALSAGRGTSCAVLDDGSLKCWGENGWGQVAPTLNGGPQATPVAIDLGGKVRAVSTNGGHTCALMVAGSIQCWGNNDKYQLGTSDTNPQFTVVTGLPSAGVTSVSAGDVHTCAVLNDDSAWCWGDNEFGQLGAGSSVAKSATPLKVKL